MSAEKQLMPDKDKSYRLITRSDMDGLMCGVLLKDLGIIDEVTFAHPKDMQDGLIEVTDDDITTNLPYVEGVYLSFDHHASEISRVGEGIENHIINPKAPSAARVVFDYFGGQSAFSHKYDEMLKVVDKADSAEFSKDEVLDPQDWVLLSFIMDARTGLGRFRDFNISNYQLMMKLIDHCRDSQEINDILSLEDVKERVDLYFEHQDKFKKQLEKCTKVHGNLALIDLRDEETIWAGNRFMIYALFPETNISVHVLAGKNKRNTVFAIGKSIINFSSNTHVGNLCLSYGGGGHEAAGTCQVDNDKAEDVLEELIEKITTDG